MKRLIATAVVILISATVSFAAENPMIAVGIEGQGGMTDIIHMSGDNSSTFDKSYSYGGGIFFEKAFTDYFGFHTGAGYRRYNFKYDISDTDSKYELDLDCLRIPFSFYIMLTWDKISISVPAGATYTNIFRAHQSEVTAGVSSEYDYIYSIRSDQFTAFSGLELRFRTSSAVDFFIGAYGEYFITDIAASGVSPSDDNIVNYYGKTGIIFRTF